MIDTEYENNVNISWRACLTRKCRIHSDASLLLLAMMDEVYRERFLNKVLKTVEFIQEVVL